MKRNWWKFIVVAALVAAVAIVVVVKGNAPNGTTSAARDSGLAAPTDGRAEESVETPAGQQPAEPASPNGAPEADLKDVSEGPGGKPQTAASAQNPPAKPANQPPSAGPAEKSKPEPSAKPQQARKKLPRLVDLGATKCIPCRMMAPILEEIKEEYKGKLIVTFIDVWENPGEGQKYGIQVIPTQIFFDENGKEFFRHEGFFSKEDILQTFRDNGIKL